MSSDKILITGASGYLGGMIAQNLPQNQIVPVQNIDLSTAESCNKICAQYQPRLIIHCAGITPKRQKERGLSQQDIYNVNMRLAQNMLDAAIENKAAVFIFISSVAVYGVPQNDIGIVSEQDRLAPLTQYGKSKADFEKILQNQNKIQSAAIRISNIIGQDGFLPAVRHATENADSPITLYGENGYVRDMIHPADIQHFFARLIEFYAQDKNSQTGHNVWNCGSGAGFSFAQIVAAAERKSGRKIKIEKQDKIPEDAVAKIICDIHKARAELNFQPQKTDLDDVIEFLFGA